MAAGAVEVAEVMADLLPEVRHAVTAGVAGLGALDLPGLRALADRRGGSRAVVVARGAVASLPVRAQAAPAAEPERRIEQLWP